MQFAAIYLQLITILQNKDVALTNDFVFLNKLLNWMSQDSSLPWTKSFLSLSRCFAVTNQGCTLWTQDWLEHEQKTLSGLLLMLYYSREVQHISLTIIAKETDWTYCICLKEFWDWIKEPRENLMRMRRTTYILNLTSNNINQWRTVPSEHIGTIRPILFHLLYTIC